MKSIFKETDYKEIVDRIEIVKQDSVRLWGTMTPAQMLAHCTEAVRIPLGESKPPRLFLGRIIGSVVKNMALSEKPFRKNSPTDPSFVMTGDKDITGEKNKLKEKLEKLYKGGTENCSNHPHTFFGHLTPEEWGILGYKHLDHHLRQFGC